MDKQLVRETVKQAVLEAYRLGVTFEQERHAQPNEDNYDGLCQFISEETERICCELTSLLS